MKPIALAAVAAALCATPALAQQREANSSLFVEGGGPGLLYSVNYELLFDDDFGIRAGFSYQSLPASGSSGSGSAPVSLITVPILVSELVSFGSSALELGGGATIIQAAGAASGNGLAVSASGGNGIASKSPAQIVAAAVMLPPRCLPFPSREHSDVPRPLRKRVPVRLQNAARVNRSGFFDSKIHTPVDGFFAGVSCADASQFDRGRRNVLRAGGRIVCGAMPGIQVAHPGPGRLLDCPGEQRGEGNCTGCGDDDGNVRRNAGPRSRADHDVAYVLMQQI